MKEFRHLTLWLAGSMVVLFGVQSFVPGFTELFVLNARLALFEPWRLLTAVFLHGSLVHIMLNLFALVLFGLILEKEIGSKNYIVFFLAAGLFSSAASMFFYDSSLGASGAIFGILGLLACLQPSMTVWISYIPMPMILAVFVWAAIDFFGILMPTNVANLAHLAGLLFGLVVGLVVRLRRPRPQSRKRGGLTDEERESLDSYERRAGLR